MDTDIGLDNAEIVALFKGRTIVDARVPELKEDGWHDLEFRLDNGTVVKLQASGYEVDGIHIEAS